MPLQKILVPHKPGSIRSTFTTWVDQNITNFFAQVIKVVANASGFVWDQKQIEGQEVNSSSFTNTLTFLTSNDSITIYVPRAFQCAAPHPPIRPPAKKNAKRVRLERISPMSDIRFRRSSYMEIFQLEKNRSSRNFPEKYFWYLSDIPL